MRTRDGGEQLVAVKTLLASGGSEGQAEFEQELALMKLLRHENLVCLLGVQAGPPPRMIMEYYSCGSVQAVRQPRSRAAGMAAGH